MSTAEPTQSESTAPLDRLARRLAKIDAPSWVAALLVALALLALLGFAPRNAALAERVALFEIERTEAAAQSPSDTVPASVSRWCERDQRIDPRSLDGRLFRRYRPAEAACWLEAIGGPGRRLYASTQLSLDVVFAVAYGLLFALLAAHAIARATRRHGSGVKLPWWWPARRALLALALGAPLCDLVENLLTAMLALRYPAGLESGQTLWVVLASCFSLAKWVLVFTTLAVLVAVGFRALGHAATYLFLGRVQLLAIALVCCVVLLATGGMPTVANTLITTTAFDLFVDSALAVLAVALVVHALLLTWELAPKRFGVEPAVLPTHVRRRLLPLGVAIALVPLLPLLVRLWLAATGEGQSLAGATFALVAGIVASFSALLVVFWVRGRVWPPERGCPPERAGGSAAPAAGEAKLPELAERASERVRSAAESTGLGSGYIDARGRIERGHGLGTLFAVLLLVAYAGLTLIPEPGDGGLPPTLAYVLITLTLLCVALSSVTFFFDRYRVPVVVPFALWLLIWNVLSPRDHVFEALAARPATAAPPVAEGSGASAEAAAAPRPDLRDAGPKTPPGGVLTVVAASGGGIQAGAWTARVLTGLQREVGAELTSSIELISSVSGGSVGTFFFLEAARHQQSYPPSDEALEPVFRAATASSLEATALGLAGPDLRRWLLPLTVKRSEDRAWAMERAWLRLSREMGEGLATLPAPTACPAAVAARRAALRGSGNDSSDGYLSSWPLPQGCGAPTVIFNATFVDDGQQALLSNADLRGLECQDSAQIDCPELRVDDPSLERHYGSTPDIAPVTAARLSATFAWVTPVARANLGAGVPPYYLADGGYFDNFGTVAAIKWLRANSERVRQARTILFIQILAFPEERSWPPSPGRGLTYSWLGPVKTLVEIRTAAQLDRNLLALKLYEASLPRGEGELPGPELRYVVLQPPLRKGHEAPLSWHLSAENVEAIEKQWDEVARGQQVEKVRAVFRQPESSGGNGSEPSPAPRR